MREYRVNHRLGLRMVGLGQRPDGGVFEVTDDKAKALRLDENPYLERIDAAPARTSKPKPKPADAPDHEEA